MDLSSIVLPNTTMKFNLSNEVRYHVYSIPLLNSSFQYDLALICDRGTHKEKWTSYKLKSFVLFLETATERLTEFFCPLTTPDMNFARTVPGNKTTNNTIPIVGHASKTPCFFPKPDLERFPKRLTHHSYPQN